MRSSRRKREREKKEELKRAKKRRIIGIVAAVAAFIAANFLYLGLLDGRFFLHATLNGCNVSAKTPAQAVELLKEACDRITVHITEQGETVASYSLAELGYTVDEEELQVLVQNQMAGESLFFWPGLIAGERMEIDIPFTVDEATYQAAVCTENLSKPRVVTENAKLVEKDGDFVIQEEVYGNNFTDADLQTAIREAVDSALKTSAQQETLEAAIPESIYPKPTITSSSESLVQRRTLYRQFSKTKVVYEFGSQTVTLDWDTFKDWMDEDTEDMDLVVSEEALYDYVSGLASEYDTYQIPREFTTTAGYTITMEYNNYGYQIDVDGEVAQLKEDLYSGSTVEREPVYAVSGFSRDGKDDLNGTYVEADLTSQHLWFYKNGSLVVETDFVSGQPSTGHETHTGVFSIVYKASPFNLEGGGGDGEETPWDVEVQYWMPFDDGQGLHDADWRSSFGGTIYQYAGSHGCLNLPPAAAAVIYEYMEAGIAIVLYQ